MPTRLRRLWWVAGLAIAVIIVIVLAPLASPDPDGLEAVAAEHGFLADAKVALYSIIPDYTVPGVSDPTVSTVLAGLVGVAIVAGFVWLLGRYLARPKV
jgi:PDGLE domain